MADAIPPALRQADINIWKCATKAAQLQAVKPIMAYWCEYWAVNQILAKQLHTTDEGILHYTTTLMDKLEQTKATYANEDAITDDAAGQAYVEQFAQETLDRAERVVKANRVTQQTATTFDAAASFFHVANVWGPVDQETQQKIKYAKWNAARIVKAIKDGLDPNESNPKHEEAAQPELDQNDPLVQSFGGAPPSSGPRPATVEDAPDTDLVRDAAGVSLPHSPASAGPSPLSDGGLQLPGVPTDLSPPAQSSYFDQEPSLPPSLQSPGHFQAPPDLPTAPSGWTPSPAASPPPAAWSQPPAAPPPGPTPYHTAPPSAPIPPPNPIPPPSSYHTNYPPPTNTARPTPPPTAPPVSYVPPARSGGFTDDEHAIAQAQKHAKWAISALNFEDVPTAVRELRLALEQLGA